VKSETDRHRHLGPADNGQLERHDVRDQVDALLRNVGPGPTGAAVVLMAQHDGIRAMRRHVPARLPADAVQRVRMRAEVQRQLPAAPTVIESTMRDAIRIRHQRKTCTLQGVPELRRTRPQHGAVAMAQRCDCAADIRTQL
jgi:hypothetical protein